MQLDGVAVPIGSLGLSYFLQVCHFVGFNMNTNKEILIRVENVEIILNQVQIILNNIIVGKSLLDITHVPIYIYKIKYLYL
jgi:hypothetical protein